MSTQQQRIREYFASRAPKPTMVAGTARIPELDDATGQQKHVDVQVGGNTVRVALDQQSPRIAAGDAVRLEQTGAAANAEYRLAGVTGARPAVTSTQFMNDATINERAYGAGDLVIGGLGASDPNFLYDFSAGTWQVRAGSDINGSWASDGTIISGASTGANVQITAGSVNVRSGSQPAITLSNTEGIKMYSGASQRGALKLDGSGWFAGSNAFYWDTAGNVVISGSISAACGTIGGWQIGPSSLYDSTANVGMRSEGSADGEIRFWAGANTPATAPFRVNRAGDTWARNVNVSGAIKAAVFEKSTVSAIAGGLMVAHDAAKLSLAYTVGGTMTLETPDTGAWVFSTGEIARIKAESTTGLGDTWFTVTRTASTNVYTTTYQSGVNSIVYPSGLTVTNYGVSGQGWLDINATDTNAPYVSINTHAGFPWNAATERVRLGNLAGITNASGYGLWTDNGYFSGKVVAASGFIGGSTGGWTIADGKITSTGIGVATATGDATYAFWAGDNTPANAEFSVKHDGALRATSASITGALTTGANSVINGAYIQANSIAASSILVTAGGANLLLNSSMQVDTISGVAEDWYLYSFSESVNTTVELSGGVDNRAFQRLAWGTNNTGVKGVYNNTNGVQGGWNPSITYVVSWWARMPSAAPSFPTMHLYWTGGKEPTSTTWLAQPSLSTTWQRFVVRIVTPASVEANGGIFISITNGYSVNGVLDIDHVQVEQADTVSAWKPYPSELEPGSITADKLSVGYLSAIAGDMGSLTAGSIVIGSTNKIWLNDSNDGGVAVGGATKASAPFRVSSTGNLVATAASITGKITANDGGFSGSINIGSAGGIYQGTGTFTSPSTGLKIWNDSGIGRIAAYSSTASQVGFGTDGVLYAAGSRLTLSSSGIQIRAHDGDKWMTFYNTNITACPNHQGFVYFQQDDPEGGVHGCLNVGITQTTDYQSIISFYENGMTMFINKNGAATYIMEASADKVVFNVPVEFTAGHS